MNRPISEAVSRGDRPTVTVAEQAPSPAAGRTQSNGVLTSGKTIQYINRWKALEGRRKELDYDVSKWCHDVRAEFPAGSAGDDMLRSWVDTELDLAANRREEILTRAAAFAALPDRAHYEGLGGFKHVRGLLDLTKREQVAAIGEAKASGSTLGPVVRARLHAKMDRHYRRYRAAHPVPVMMSFDLRHTPQENEAWTRAAAGQKLEDWVRSVCNAAAKVKRK